MSDDKETTNTHVRNLPVWVKEEIEKAAKEEYRPFNSQILAILTEWAERRRSR